MINKFAAAAVLASVFVTPAFADWYIVQDTTTKKCTVVEKRPTVSTEVVVGPDGTVYKTREEATTGMKTVKVCETK